MAHGAPEQTAQLRTVETAPMEPVKLVAATSQGREVDPAAGLLRLFKVEDRLRACRSRSEFAHALSNELLALVGARQIVVFSRRSSGWRKNIAGGRWAAICLSGLAGVERDAPLVRALEAFVAHRASREAGDASPSGHGTGHGAVRRLELSAVRDTDRALVAKYPFREAAWLPLHLRDGTCFAGLLLLRAQAWSDDDVTLLERQAPMIADTWTAIAGPARLRPRTRRHRLLATILAAFGAAALALPVPMTTLAPVEIVAQAPQLVTAPINGVIADVHVRENTRVAQGDKLLSYVDTELRNVFALASREADVAIANHERLRQAAFSDEASRHQLSIAETEMRLRIAERNFARDRLREVDVRAERDGLSEQCIATGKHHDPVALGAHID
ncbi:MAG: biotin/lipoyl-binding protein, partial [Pseudomonadota bacterium]